MRKLMSFNSFLEEKVRKLELSRGTVFQGYQAARREKIRQRERAWREVSD